MEFGELYGAVQMSGLFSDQKTFADAIPDKPPSQIVADYEKQKQLPGFDLKAFVALHFATPRDISTSTSGAQIGALATTSTTCGRC